MPFIAALHNTVLHTWFERDRSHVELVTLAGETIVEWWDEDCQSAFEDGFLDRRNLHQSAYDYAVHVGLLTAP